MKAIAHLMTNHPFINEGKIIMKLKQLFFVLAILQP